MDILLVYSVVKYLLPNTGYILLLMHAT